MSRPYVMWGWTGRYGVRIIMAIMAGSLKDCRERQKQFRGDYSDAITGIYLVGTEPKALSLKVKEHLEGSVA
jgi:hypothetical protein